MDILAQNHGTIWLFQPTSKAGQRWLNENVGESATRWGTAIVVEHRYVADLASGALGDSLDVRSDWPR